MPASIQIGYYKDIATIIVNSDSTIYYLYYEINESDKSLTI